VDPSEIKNREEEEVLSSLCCFLCLTERGENGPEKNLKNDDGGVHFAIKIGFPLGGSRATRPDGAAPPLLTLLPPLLPSRQPFLYPSRSLIILLYLYEKTTREFFISLACYYVRVTVYKTLPTLMRAVRKTLMFF